MQDPESGFVFVAGGWDASSSFKITKIHIPSDLCHLFSKSKYLCRRFVGCSFCTVSESNNEKKTNCFTNGQSSSVCEAREGFLSYNHGTACDDVWISKRNCTSFTSCSACLAAWPAHQEKNPVCQWCSAEECEVVGGKCVSAKADCSKESQCDTFKSIGLPDQCPEISCAAFDCESCLAKTGCSWTGNEKDFKCISTEIADQKSLNAFNSCPAKCDKLEDCKSCLKESSTEGGYSQCHWSTRLHKCISPAYQPLYCVGGICGLMLAAEDHKECPESCESYGQCSKCLQNAHCGWCSANGLDGEGVCIEGSLDRSSNDSCAVEYAMHANVSVTSVNFNFTWNYVKCPRENECTNRSVMDFIFSN